MAFSCSVVSAVGNATSAITLGSPVMSTTTKLSLVTDAQAGGVRRIAVCDVQCQAPAEWCRKPASSRNRHSSAGVVRAELLAVAQRQFERRALQVRRAGSPGCRD